MLPQELLHSSPLMPIVLLDDQTINQIAAGEVIEKPASVVKELVENAIDAQATRIQVRLLQGGRDFIEVTDNGCGFHFEDLPLAFQRHATSKILCIDDVFRLNSMGFRGEALASIASCAKVEVFSLLKKDAQDPLGASHFVIEGGKILTHEKTASALGTIFRIRDLFFNQPVRAHFNRGYVFDTQEVVKIMTRLALANPQLAFKLICDGKEQLSTTYQENVDQMEAIRARIQTLLGVELAKQLIPIDQEKQGIRLFGYLLPPQFHRANRLGQYLFVQGRTCESKYVSQAVRMGFGTSLPEGRFPRFVLFLTFPEGGVDVNVHPQKSEVRFAQKGVLESLIVQTIQRALNQEVFRVKTLEQPSVVPLQHTWSYEEMPPHVEQTLEVHQPTLPFGTPTPTIVHTLPGLALVLPSSLPTLFPEGGSLGLVDLEAVFLKSLLTKQGKEETIASQALAVSLVVDVSYEEAKGIEALFPFLSSCGFQLQLFSPTSFSIEAIPCSMEPAEIKDFLLDTLQKWQKGSTMVTPQKREEETKKKLSSLFAKKAVSIASATKLLEGLLLTEAPQVGPYGETLATLLESKDLRRLIKKRKE